MAEKIQLTLLVNGVERSVQVWPMARLLDVIREDLGLKGTKEGCGEGECGACAVLLDGVLVNSCLVPAYQAQGTDLLTIEGLADQDNLNRLQQSFLRHNAAQCGYCSPGMLMSATDLLRRHPSPDMAAIREAIGGNLCRCTGYVKIIEAVQEAARGEASCAS
ncbi:(2Fe-2S)-binding protein [Paludibacterium sp. B53371]|uniref:(2Fe-2S)-binding protein n=1 Tax=Paludibacterium sp. B53371 TaxID=2806263 RepID=UPI001C0469A8|nr:(2Fe-2S)-binding protein [Paludibacterium sp. B53371]